MQSESNMSLPGEITCAYLKKAFYSRVLFCNGFQAYVLKPITALQRIIELFIGGDLNSDRISRKQFCGSHVLCRVFLYGISVLCHVANMFVFEPLITFQIP